MYGISAPPPPPPPPKKKKSKRKQCSSPINLGIFFYLRLYIIRHLTEVKKPSEKNWPINLKLLTFEQHIINIRIQTHVPSFGNQFKKWKLLILKYATSHLSCGDIWLSLIPEYLNLFLIHLQTNQPFIFILHNTINYFTVTIKVYFS